MFGILVNGVFLDVDSTTVRLEIVNSIFEQDALQGDWSFPFQVKWTDKNGKALGFSNMLEVPNKKVSYNASFYFGTKNFITGRLILNGGGNNYFNCNIAGGVKGLINAEAKLKDLNYINPITGDGTIVLDSLTTASIDYQTADYKNIISFPTHSNPNFYGNNNADFLGLVNNVIPEDGTNPQNTPAFGGNKYCLVPFLYLFYILETIFKEDGLTMSGSFKNDSEWSTALLYNNFALDYQAEQGCLVKIAYDQPVNIDQTPGSNVFSHLVDLPAGCYNPENNWDNANYWYVMPVNGSYSAKFTGSVLGYDSVLAMPGSGILKVAIATWHGSFYTEFASQTITVAVGATEAISVEATIPNGIAADQLFVIFYNGDVDADMDTHLDSECNVTVLAGSQLIVAKYDDQLWNKMTKTITISNHVPDMTVEELLNELKKLAQLNFIYDFKNNTVFIDFIEDILNRPPEKPDLSDVVSKNYELVFDDANKGYVVGFDFGSTDNLVANNFIAYDTSKLIGVFTSVDNLPANSNIGDIAIVQSTNKVMQMAINGLDLVWQEFTDNYFDVTTGAGETEVKSRLAPMMMLNAETESTDEANARALVPAISESGSSPMFNLGINTPSLRLVFMRGMNSGGQYVYASSTNYDQYGIQKGNYSLKMNDPDGLFIKFHQKIITALTNSNIVQRDLLADIDLLSSPNLMLKRSADNIHWLLKSISIIIGSTIKASTSYWLKL